MTNWKDRFPECNKNTKKAKEDIHILKSWIGHVPERAFKDRTIFNELFRKNFDTKNAINEIDLISFKNYCEGQPLIFNEINIPKRIFKNLIKQTNLKKDLTSICHDIIHEKKSLKQFKLNFDNLLMKSDELRFWANDGGTLRKKNSNFLYDSIVHINFVIEQIFQDIVNHSQLNTEDKKLLIKSIPIPEVRLLNQEGWNGYYQGESDNPPLRPKIYLKPTMIQNFSKPMISDYLMNTISHELGADFFASMANEFNFDFLPSWNKEKGYAYLCTIEDDYNSQLHSQASRNPPQCIKSLWNPN